MTDSLIQFLRSSREKIKQRKDGRLIVQNIDIKSNRRTVFYLFIYPHLRVKIQETKSDNARHTAFGKCIILFNILEKWVEYQRKGEEVEQKIFHAHSKKKIIIEPRRHLYIFWKETMNCKVQRGFENILLKNINQFL